MIWPTDEQINALPPIGSFFFMLGAIVSFFIVYACFVLLVLICCWGIEKIKAHRDLNKNH